MLRLFSMDIAGIGRIDTSSLTDQQMMEMFFVPDNLEDAREALLGDEDDACTWSKVTCDGSDHITEIDWHSIYFTLQGSIDFPMMPRHLEYFNLYDQKLVGAVDTTNLPEALQYFCIEECFFTGTLDLGNLPHKLDNFIVMDNKITGLVNFCNLPSSLVMLFIKEPIESSKQIRIGKLPKSLNDIFLQVKGTEMLYFEEKSDRGRVKMKEV